MHNVQGGVYCAPWRAAPSHAPTVLCSCVRVRICPQICVVGVTTQSVGNDLIYPATVLEPISTLKGAVNDARNKEGCSAVIVLSHLG